MSEVGTSNFVACNCGTANILLAVAMVVAGCSPSDELEGGTDGADLAVDSHTRMVNVLQTVRGDVYRDSYWFGERALETHRAAVAELTDETPSRHRFDAHFRLGVSELRHGQVLEAIKNLELAESLFMLTGFPAQSLDSCRYNLGLAYLRLGENENCCKSPDGETCVFPIREAGVHLAKEGSRKALVEFLAVARSPDAHAQERANANWLAVVAAMTLGEYPEVIPQRLQLTNLDRTRGDVDFPRFENIGQSLGVDRFGLAGAMIIDDFDADGDDDLISSSWDPAIDLAYFERTADGRFVDVSEAAGLKGIAGGLNLRHADIDNDGDLDVLVLRGGWMADLGRQPNSMLRNDGKSHFTDITFACGLADVSYPTQTAEWSDFDLDGDLDVFIGNEGSGIEAPCQLFRNDGPDSEGMVRFVDIAKEAGVEVNDYVKGVAWGDFNGDRFPDLYVSCFTGANRLYQNRGEGKFTDVAKTLGVSEPIHSFPVWFWDYNNDGNLDLFVSGFSWRNDAFLNYYQGKAQAPENAARLYRGSGDGYFEEVHAVGLDVPMMTMGSSFGDLDNDGYADLYLGTGSPDTSAVVPNLLLMNRGGARFDNVTNKSGLGHLQKGHGIAFADFDRDGDLDVFEQMGGAFPSDAYFDAAYENPGFGNHWLQVRLRGTKSNSFGIGCRLRAVINDEAGERSVYTWLNGGGSFGANPLVAHLGLGEASVVDRLEVFWPLTGETQVIENIHADRRVIVTEGDAKILTSMEVAK